MDSSVFAFYKEDGPVTILTQKNFDELVLKSGWWSSLHRLLFRFRFICSWCGHCKAMKDEWIKAAGAMGGIVHFGAVDSTVEQSLAARYGVQGIGYGK